MKKLFKCVIKWMLIVMILYSIGCVSEKPPTTGDTTDPGKTDYCEYLQNWAITVLQEFFSTVTIQDVIDLILDIVEYVQANTNNVKSVDNVNIQTVDEYVYKYFEVNKLPTPLHLRTVVTLAVADRMGIF